MREGLSQLQKHIATFGSRIENITYLLSLKIALESHIAKALEASHAVPIDQEHFLYIDIRDSVLCLDQPKQYYFTMTDGELSKCKLAEPSRYVCKHPRTLLSTVTTDSCAVTLLQKRYSLPPV
jgi:hypothetical protein